MLYGALRCYIDSCAHIHTKAAIIVQVPLLTRYLTPRNSTKLPCVPSFYALLLLLLLCCCCSVCFFPFVRALFCCRCCSHTFRRWKCCAPSRSLSHTFIIMSSRSSSSSVEASVDFDSLVSNRTWICFSLSLSSSLLVSSDYCFYYLYSFQALPYVRTHRFSSNNNSNYRENSCSSSSFCRCFSHWIIRSFRRRTRNAIEIYIVRQTETKWLENVCIHRKWLEMMIRLRLYVALHVLLCVRVDRMNERKEQTSEKSV